MKYRKKSGIIIIICMVMLFVIAFPARVSAFSKTIVTNAPESLYVNDEYRLKMKIDTTKCIDYSVTSSKKSVLEVEYRNGIYQLKAKKKGTAKIKVVDEDGRVYQTFSVKVKNRSFERIFNAQTEVIGVGEKVTLTKKSGWTFSSRFPNIATVDKKGKVTGKAEGTTYIVAEDKNGNIDCKVVIVLKNKSYRKEVKSYEKRLRKAGKQSMNEYTRELILSDTPYLKQSDLKETIYQRGMKDGVGWAGYKLNDITVKWLSDANVDKNDKKPYFIAYYDGMILFEMHGENNQ